MVIFLVVFYLLLCFIVMMLKRKKPKRKYIKSKNKRVLSFYAGKALFFCSRLSFEYLMLKKAYESQIFFKNDKDYLKIVLPLKNSGINFYNPVYKLECYKDFDIVKIYLQMQQFKRLEDKGFDFNLFIFVDDYKNLKKLIKIKKTLGFKKADVRVFHCLEINFDLLCSINFLNLMQDKNLKNKKAKMGLLKPKSVDIEDDLFFKNLEDNNLSFCFNNNIFEIKNYQYKDYALNSCFECDYCKIDTFLSYNYKEKCKIFKIKTTNNIDKKISLKMCFGTIFNKKIPKNCLYVFKDAFDGFCFEDINCNKKFYMKAKNVNLQQNKNKDIFITKDIKLDAFKTCYFYVAIFDDRQNFECFKGDLSKTFDDNSLNYNCLNLPVLFSSNEVLNKLVNTYLPQKIIKNFILNPKKYGNDFYSLLLCDFNPHLVNKDLVSGNLNKIFLLNKDLFCVYQNLLYFYAGFFANKNGINLNLDKSFLIEDTKVDFFNNKQKRTLFLKNNNLKDEFKINNRIYSNLNFLNLNDNQNQIEIFY